MITHLDQDTIYAPLTPVVRSAIIVIRVSGSHADKLFPFFSRDIFTCPRVARLVRIRDTENLIIDDEAMVIWFPSPNSFTGEDVIEISLHGGVAIARKMFKLLEALNFRYARPGEFTKRAVQNGKMSIEKAEVTADLINAETAFQMQIAQRSIGTSAHFAKWYEQLINILASIEAMINFEDETDPQDLTKIATTLSDLKCSASNIANNTVEELVTAGTNIVIFGPPNAGKSSLINYMTKNEISIVSDIPGTTRDSIETAIEINGHKVFLTDTAGIREASNDQIEQEGIRRTLKKLTKAQIKLALIDYKNLTSDYQTIANLIDPCTILVANKADLESRLKIQLHNTECLLISLHKDHGIDNLLHIIGCKLDLLHDPGDDAILIRERYKSNIKAFLGCLNTIQTHLDSIEILSHKLQTAAELLKQAINQNYNPEEVLDKVFSKFCIGK